MPSPLPQSFLVKKRRILEQLSVPTEEYDDLSPKGSVDEGIRDLIDEINALEGCVTTSSCAGRISVFLEGKKSSSGLKEHLVSRGLEVEQVQSTTAGVGGKGGGGRWLFVSHDPVDAEADKNGWIATFGMQSKDLHDEVPMIPSSEAVTASLIHFKFEPMILHVLTASLQHAQIVLAAALQAGFRESGALGLVSNGSELPTPMVGIRSMGLALESVIGFQRGDQLLCVVPEWQLRNLVEISKRRFVENTKRIERFRILLKEMAAKLSVERRRGENGGEWEDAQARKERKRAEGLDKAQRLKAALEDDQESGSKPDLGLELIL